MNDIRRYPHTARALREFLAKKHVKDLAALEAALGLSSGYFRNATGPAPRGRPSLAVLTKLSQHLGLKGLAPSLKKGYDADNEGFVKPSDVVDDSLPPAARWLKTARVKAGLSQAELSRRLAVLPTLVSRVERGAQRPSTELLQSAARILHASIPDALLTANATARYRARWGIDALAAAVAPASDSAPQKPEPDRRYPASSAALRAFLSENGLTSLDFVAQELGLPKSTLNRFLSPDATHRPSRSMLMKLMAMTGRTYLASGIVAGWLADDAPRPTAGTAAIAARWLQKTRCENLFSIDELASSLGISPARLAALEAGKSPLSATLLEKVAADCKTTVPPDVLRSVHPTVTLGMALKDARCAAGLSRRAVAERSGLSEDAIRAMETTDAIVSDEALTAFALACELASVPKRWFYLRRTEKRLPSAGSPGRASDKNPSEAKTTDGPV